MEIGRRRDCVLATVVALAAAGCGGSETTTSSASATPGERRAVATLQSKSGTAVSGTATFEQVGNDPVRVRVRVERATPGLHGLHVHMTGDCSDPEAKAAGGHFNPFGAPHAGPQTQKRHVGDLGNIMVGKNGTGELEMLTNLLTVQAGPASVVGRSVVFHTEKDDLTTQPGGDSGARQGCGVVVASSSS
jgi:Cu-Zn family superoxide dismutase